MAKSTKHKIIKPRILHRGHVKKDLEKIFSTPLFFIISSMGFGKTTAVRDFLNKKRKVKNIWFTFDEDTTEDLWTWIKFCRTLEMTNAQMGRIMFERGIPVTDGDFERLISGIRSIMETEMVIVLDDMHLCKSRQLSNVVLRIAEAAIPQLHFVIIGRTVPQFIDVDELVSQGKAHVMNQDSFVFSRMESEDFFILNDAPLKEKEANLLYEKTKGWTSALYLALLYYRAYGEFESMEVGTELMRRAVYERYDEEEKNMLLMFSRP